MRRPLFRYMRHHTIIISQGTTLVATTTQFITKIFRKGWLDVSLQKNPADVPPYTFSQIIRNPPPPAFLSFNFAEIYFKDVLERQTKQCMEENICEERLICWETRLVEGGVSGGNVWSPRKTTYVARSAADAPSVKKEEFAAVTVPCGLMKAARNLAMRSMELTLMPLSCKEFKM